MPSPSTASLNVLLCFPSLSTGSMSFSYNQLSGTVPSALSTAFPANASAWTSTCITGCTLPANNCSMRERPFLVELFANSDTSLGGSTSSWFDQTTSPCSWKGVSCSSAGAITYVAVAASASACYAGRARGFRSPVLSCVCHIIMNCRSLAMCFAASAAPCSCGVLRLAPRYQRLSAYCLPHLGMAVAGTARTKGGKVRTTHASNSGVTGLGPVSGHLTCQ